MTALALALWFLAALLFLIDGVLWWRAPTGWSRGSFQSLGLLFLTLGFILGAKPAF